MTTSQAQPLNVLQGSSKRIELFADRVVITPTDFLTQIGRGFFGKSEIIPLNHVKEVHFYEPRALNGLMRFILRGENHTLCDVVFNRHNLQPAQALRCALEGFISRRDVGHSSL